MWYNVGHFVEELLINDDDYSNFTEIQLSCDPTNIALQIIIKQQLTPFMKRHCAILCQLCWPILSMDFSVFFVVHSIILFYKTDTIVTYH